MSNSGSGAVGDVTLKIAVPYVVILRVLRELDHSNERQHAVAEELLDTLPNVILARVEAEQITPDRLT